MRFIYLLLITFIFASCGNQKMRFIRSNTEKQKVVEISETPTIKKKSETAFNSEPKPKISKQENTSLHNGGSQNDPNLSTDDPISSIPENTRATPFPESVQDSVTVTTQEVDDITNEALKAERDGTLSLTFSILIYAFLILGIIALLLTIGQVEFVIGAIVMGILFLVSLVLSFIFGFKSLRSKYNTPRGRRRAITGLILAGIPLAYMLVSTLFGLF